MNKDLKQVMDKIDELENTIKQNYNYVPFSLEDVHARINFDLALQTQRYCDLKQRMKLDQLEIALKYDIQKLVDTMEKRINCFLGHYKYN